MTFPIKIKTHFPLNPPPENEWKGYLNFLKKDQSAFTQLPSEEELKKIQEMAKHFSHKEQLVHIGIGGSSLGTKTIFNALSPQNAPLFIEGIEESINWIFEKINLEKTVFHIVSKSGNTTEVLCNLQVILKGLNKRGVSPEKYQDLFLITSSGLNGELNKFQKKHKLKELLIPELLGGRFSVLSPVGLFPAQFYGLDIFSLVKGAAKAESFLKEDRKTFQQLGQTYVELLKKYGIGQSVLMPYDERLQEFTQWFCQLWGESLGKKGQGLTPLASLGSKDQHSLMQLYLEGPLDKFIGFITVKKEDPYLEQGVSALQLGCELALEELKRPLYKISLESLNEESLGALFQFYQYLVTLIAFKLELNPYDQPAVELAKKYTKGILNGSISE